MSKYTVEERDLETGKVVARYAREELESGAVEERDLETGKVIRSYVEEDLDMGTPAQSRTVTITLSREAAAELEKATGHGLWTADSVVSDIVEEWAQGGRPVAVPEELQWAVAPVARA